eukprot:7005453-Lingulodinium_polyedra.AAC.1
MSLAGPQCQRSLLCARASVLFHCVREASCLRLGLRACCVSLRAPLLGSSARFAPRGPSACAELRRPVRH